ncbi:MAG: thermonuclease family protein [Firmicutes bacterium]|nr:thermonuclease family protein [Bacillota bacterium]
MKYRMIGAAVVSFVLIIIGVVCWLIFTPHYLVAESFSIPDGDNVLVTVGGKTENVRLLHIDAPEYNQPYGYQAKEFARVYTKGKKIKIKHWNKRDPYGRLLGIAILDDGTILNQVLVQEGFAWWYRYFSSDKSYEKLESNAKRYRRGLWIQDSPTPPWEWRRRNNVSGW